MDFVNIYNLRGDLAGMRVFDDKKLLSAEEFAEIFDKLQAEIDLLWFWGHVYEDDLPEMSEEKFKWLFAFSKVDGVRIYPKILVDALKGGK